MSTNVVLRLQFFFSFSPKKLLFHSEIKDTVGLVQIARKHLQQKKGDENVINTLICEIMFALQSSTFTGARVVSAKNATRRCVSFSLALNTLFRARKCESIFFSSLLFLFGDHKDSSFCGKRRDRGETTSRPLVVFVVKEWKEQLPLGVVVVREDALAHLFPSVLVSVPDHYYTPLVPIQNQQIKSLY